MQNGGGKRSEENETKKGHTAEFICSRVAFSFQFCAEIVLFERNSHFIWKSCAHNTLTLIDHCGDVGSEFHFSTLPHIYVWADTTHWSFHLHHFVNAIRQISFCAQFTEPTFGTQGTQLRNPRSINNNVISVHTFH